VSPGLPQNYSPFFSILWISKQLNFYGVRSYIGMVNEIYPAVNLRQFSQEVQHFNNSH
jgi:hypothetical protein